MFFLLRVAFWLTIVLALLPSGGTQQSAQAKVGPTEAVVAAGAAVSDMSSFCDRQPGACVVGAQTAVAIGQRAQAGARMVYEFFSDHAARGNETGSVTKAKSEPKPGQNLLLMGVIDETYLAYPFFGSPSDGALATARMAQPLRARVGVVQHARGELLRARRPAGDHSARAAGNLQHRPGLPVHLGGV